MITVSAFPWVPPFARGLVRDLRVRWALEEAGLPYRTRLLAGADQESAAYRDWQPFGQVPAYEDDDGLRLFESGAIVHHIARRSPALMPPDEAGQARATSWIFAALNSVEPAVAQLATIDLFYAEEDWAKARRPGVEANVRKRLAELDRALGDRDWLEGRFTAGDLMMVHVLRILRHTDLVEQHPRLEAYRRRGEARPAHRRALAAQMADFADEPPGG